MRNIKNHIQTGLTLLQDKEQLRASEIVELLIDTGLTGSERTEQIIDVVKNSFLFGVAVGYLKRGKETMIEKTIRPEAVQIVKAFDSLPENLKPEALENCLKILNGKATAAELITAAQGGTVTQ